MSRKDSAYERYKRGEVMTLVNPSDPPKPLHLHETLRYPCGCEASGTYPLPTYCPTHGTPPAETLVEQPK